MESRKGVIPRTSAQVKLVKISLSQILAIGIESSLYLFDSKSGENIMKVNHYPAAVVDAEWKGEGLEIVSIDDSGDLIESKVSGKSNLRGTVQPGFLCLNTNISNGYWFVLYEKQVLILNQAFLQVGIIQTGGFKLILDYFCPWKVVILYEKGVKCLNDWNFSRARKGKVKKVLDGVLNPSALNSLFLLKADQLIEFDSHSMTTSKVLALYPHKMIKILSCFSNEIWALSEDGILTPSNTLIPIEFVSVFSGFWTSEEKLPICLAKNNLEIDFGFLSNSISITAKVQLGINTKFWNLGMVNEKVLVFYQDPFLLCFSFSKERVIRKLKAGKVSALTCSLNFCFYIEDSFKLNEWKITSGETRTLKTYSEKIVSVLINKKANTLAVASGSFLDMFSMSKQIDLVQRINISALSAMTWSDDDSYLLVGTSTDLIKVSKNTENFICQSLVSAQLSISEIIEVSGEIFLQNYSNWFKLIPNTQKLVPELIQKIDEINIGTSKAEFKSFGLLYRDSEKTSQQLSQLRPVQLSQKGNLIERLIHMSEQRNNLKHNIFWRVAKDFIENPPEDFEEPKNKEKSFYSSPGNITPSRRPIKRSVSPLNKSRKSITPKRVQKMQSDPKDIIQLAVDTSSLLSSTQNFQKDPTPKSYYILEYKPSIKGNSSNFSDFLTGDKKNLVKKLMASNDEKDLLLGCIIAGTLGRQDLQKAIENSCQKLTGLAGVFLNLANGSRGKAFELLSSENFYQEVAHCSKMASKFDEFFEFIIKLYENGFKFQCALHLFFSGFTPLALQVLCKDNEEELVYWLSQIDLKFKREVPAEFENWFYELGPPRFRSKFEEDLRPISDKFNR